MFISIWLGIMDIRTGEITASSAGHEYPFVTDRDGRFVKYTDPHGFVCGATKGMKFETER